MRSAPAWSSRPGRTARNVSSCSRGDDQRRGQPEHIGPRSVDDEAGVQRRIGHGWRHRFGQQRWPGAGRDRVRRRPAGARGPELRPAGARPSRWRWPADRRARSPPWPPARRSRRPGCRRTCCRGCPGPTAVAAGPRAMQAPTGKPLPSPLATVTMSARTPSATWASQSRSGPFRSGPRRSRAERRARSQISPGLEPGSPSAAPRPRSRPGSAPAPPPPPSSSTAARQGVGVAVRDEIDVARQRRERLAVLRVVGDRQGAERPAVERPLGRDDLGPAGHPGDLERRLVGLGAGVGEEDLRFESRAGSTTARQPLRPARPGPGWRRSWRRDPGWRSAR